MILVRRAHVGFSRLGVLRPIWTDLTDLRARDPGSSRRQPVNVQLEVEHCFCLAHKPIKTCADQWNICSHKPSKCNSGSHKPSKSASQAVETKVLASVVECTGGISSSYDLKSTLPPSSSSSPGALSRKPHTPILHGQIGAPLPTYDTPFVHVSQCLQEFKVSLFA